MPFTVNESVTKMRFLRRKKKRKTRGGPNSRATTLQRNSSEIRMNDCYKSFIEIGERERERERGGGEVLAVSPCELRCLPPSLPLLPRNTYRLVGPLITFIELLCRSYLSIGPITANQSRTQRTVGLRQTSADEISQSTAGQWASMIRSCLAGFASTGRFPYPLSFLSFFFFLLLSFSLPRLYPGFREPLSFSTCSSRSFCTAVNRNGEH